MEGSVSSVSNYADEDKALKSLLEAFGSMFSFEQIASAYCKAGRDANVAGQILCKEQGSTSVSMNKCAKSSLPLPTDTFRKSFHQNGKHKDPRKKYPAVSGSVSSFLGKNYVNPAPKANGCNASTKSSISDESAFPMSELCGEANEKNPTKSNEHMHVEMGNFLFKMLGDGFQLGRDVIRQVLDKCGYDMTKSMDKLLDLSASTLEARKKHSGELTETSINACPISDELPCKKGLQAFDSSEWEIIPRPIEERDIQKEVLVSLFADKSEESPRAKARAMRASRVYGRPVCIPLRDIDITSESEKMPVNSHQNVENASAGDAEEDSYQLLRDAVKEHRAMMKEYYKAAVEAFAMGEFDRADKLMKQGHFYHQKANEADEESSRKIFETRHRDTQNDMLLELQELGTKEAVRLLRCHLSSLSGISSIKFLKVILETTEEDATKGARRRWVKKVLEKESIPWTEGEDGGSILIRLDNIDPTSLSFAKKS